MMETLNAILFHPNIKNYRSERNELEVFFEKFRDSLYGHENSKMISMIL